jgi:hypothetical protein
MHPALQYTLAFLGAGLIGLASAAIVLSLGWLIDRRNGVKIETTLGIAGVVGLAMMIDGRTLGHRGLSLASLALCGWMILPFLAIPPLLLWRLVTWLLGKN